MKRGDMITTVGGGNGWYVGTRNGVQWVCYAGQDFDAMCRAFDKAYVVKDKRAVKPFRKTLAKRVRQGTATLRVFGSKGEWFLGVQIGRTIHRYSVSLITQTTAVLAGHREFGIKASLYKSRAAA